MTEAELMQEYPELWLHCMNCGRAMYHMRGMYEICPGCGFRPNGLDKEAADRLRKMHGDVLRRKEAAIAKAKP